MNMYGCVYIILLYIDYFVFLSLPPPSLSPFPLIFVVFISPLQTAFLVLSTLCISGRVICTHKAMDCMSGSVCGFVSISVVLPILTLMVCRCVVCVKCTSTVNYVLSWSVNHL